LGGAQTVCLCLFACAGRAKKSSRPVWRLGDLPKGGLSARDAFIVGNGTRSEGRGAGASRGGGGGGEGAAGATVAAAR
jgi:hypothetical protein